MQLILIFLKYQFPRLQERAVSKQDAGRGNTLADIRNLSQPHTGADNAKQLRARMVQLGILTPEQATYSNKLKAPNVSPVGPGGKMAPAFQEYLDNSKHEFGALDAARLITSS